jgi:undecaprenyl-diphosphatase
MTTLLQAIILGIIQGITEWLPISSSGHLVLAQNLFGLAPPVIFDVILHLGTLIVIFIVFAKDIKELCLGVFKREKKHLKMLLYLFLGSLPIAFAGLLFNDFIKSIFHSPVTVGISLLFTALLLFLSKYPRKDKKLTITNTFIVGLAQMLAILPGISRSGSTIAVGLMQGIKREEAARFSFLLVIPAILGATLLEIGNLGTITNMPALIAGTITSIVVGYIALRLLLHIIKKGKFYLFGWYCLALGIIVLLLAFL